jgi:hydroxymethylpyrimidine pyrophosphatase-like HAD family hydrolase
MYGEPMPIEIPSIAGHAPGIHKILICDDDLDKLAQVRTELEALAKLNNATVTQAVPTMLEFLPEGCSKALGVEKVCDALGLDATTDLLSLGDAENDVEMLEMSAVGVCVGNGSKLAKDAADIVLDETSDEGGAGLAIEALAGV